jgi:hypothetical protein
MGKGKGEREKPLYTQISTYRWGRVKGKGENPYPLTLFLSPYKTLHNAFILLILWSTENQVS